MTEARLILPATRCSMLPRREFRNWRSARMFRLDARAEKTAMDPIAPTTTGRELALRMNKAFPGEDWIASFVQRSGRSRDVVEWHLQEDMSLPRDLLSPAGEMLGEKDRQDRVRPKMSVSRRDS
ncbi:hypothetical protein AB6806_28230 [Bosea sp. RCC_152_1]|uniref:hypothetical protein n=1 Tax=Bosea sp. RCC_152_1 TaxID=3239228 RepID=UPI0035241D29